jgi:NAD(P)-dependent dehydrogenase (short-subunit alcohol dehydrogenase family)
LPAKDEARPLCLVTGGARRLGAAMVRHLAASFNVAIHFNLSEADAKALAAEVTAMGARAETFRADLADDAQAAALVQRVAARMGPIDLLVNSASTFKYDSPSEFDAAMMKDLLAVNLVAPMVIAREFAKVASPRAVLVNMLDNKVFAPNPDFFSYSLAKFALKGAVDMLAMHYRGRMRVAGIAPGVTLISGNQSEENFRKSWRHSLTGTGATPEEIARTVEFIWRTTSINGEIIVLDGGQHLMSLQRDVAFVVQE